MFLAPHKRGSLGSECLDIVYEDDNWLEVVVVEVLQMMLVGEWVSLGCGVLSPPIRSLLCRNCLAICLIIVVCI